MVSYVSHCNFFVLLNRFLGFIHLRKYYTACHYINILPFIIHFPVYGHFSWSPVFTYIRLSVWFVDKSGLTRSQDISMFDLTQYYQILPKITKNFPKWLFPLSIVLKYFPQMKIHYRHASEVIQVQFHTTNITIRQGTHFFGFAEHIRSDVCTTKVMFLRMYTAICIQAPAPS